MSVINGANCPARGASVPHTTCSHIGAFWKKNRFCLISRQVRLLIELRELKVTTIQLLFLLLVVVIVVVVVVVVLLLLFIWLLINLQNKSFSHHVTLLWHCYWACLQNCKKATISFAMSVCPSVHLSTRLSAWNNSASTRRIFVKFDIWGFFENLSRKFNFH